MIDEETGRYIVKLARKIIESHLKGDEIEIEEYPEELDKERGVFVTLNKNNELRGCIGVPEAKKPLIKALEDAAQSVCNDPRFPSLSKEELDNITIEISVLTEPKIIEGEEKGEILENVEKGEDGLILERGMNKGLFLPQVWNKVSDKEDFLSQLCFKAGLGDPSAWLSEESNLYKFQVQAFKEKEPKGEIIEE